MRILCALCGDMYTHAHLLDTVIDAIVPFILYFFATTAAAASSSSSSYFSFLLFPFLYHHLHHRFDNEFFLHLSPSRSHYFLCHFVCVNVGLCWILFWQSNTIYPYHIYKCFTRSRETKIWFWFAIAMAKMFLFVLYGISAAGLWPCRFFFLVFISLCHAIAF